MGVLYVIQVVVPGPATPAFPPSVLQSDWMDGLIDGIERYGIAGTGAATSGTFTTMFHFPSTEEATAWISSHKLSDATLSADLEAWKSLYNIQFNHYFYNLTVNPTVTDIGIF